MKKISRILVVLLASASAQAELSMPEIHGFLTAGMATSTTSSLFDGSIANNFGFAPSRVGITLYEALDDQWSTTVQWVGRANQPNFFQEIDWAVVRWQPISSLLVRAGKQQIPTWLTSDHREIGYLYPWVRTPIEVYYLNPVSSYIGLSLNYTLPVVENWKLNFSGYAGGVSTSYQVSPTQTVAGTANNLVGGTLGFGNGKILVRGSYLQTELDLNTVVSSDNFVSTIGAFTRTLIIVPIRGMMKIWSAGTRLDLANFLVYSEYAGSVSDSPVRSSAGAFYGTVGYYLFDRSLLPHFTYANTFDYTSSFGNSRQTSGTLGLNYFISSQVVLKGDWQYIQIPSGSRGFFDSTVTSNSSQSVFDLALSVVF